MGRETKPRHSRRINGSKPEPRSTLRPLHSKEGWYEPEALNSLQHLFDALWLKLRKQVFPFDVEAERERLAKQIFEGFPDARGDVEHLKHAILTLWQEPPARQQVYVRRGNSRHYANGSNAELVTPIYDAQHLPAP